MIAFNWSAFLTLGILSATIHWSIARAKLTEWIWNAIWLPEALDELLRCPACSGFWIGLGLGLAGLCPLSTGHWWLDIATAGFAGVFATPIAEGMLLWGLEHSRIH
jgi:hypothetical protein